MNLTGLRLEPEELRAQHRNKRKRTDGRNDHDDADDPSELLEHESGHTLDHCKRQEHRKHGKSRSYHGYTDLLGRMNCSFLRFCSPLKMCRYVLQHYDGIIHNHTDGN